MLESFARYFRIDVHGLENIPSAQALIAPNHSGCSVWTAVMLTYLLKKSCLASASLDALELLKAFRFSLPSPNAWAQAGFDGERRHAAFASKTTSDLFFGEGSGTPFSVEAGLEPHALGDGSGKTEGFEEAPERQDCAGCEQLFYGGIGQHHASKPEQPNDWCDKRFCRA